MSDESQISTITESDEKLVTNGGYMEFQIVQVDTWFLAMIHCPSVLQMWHRSPARIQVLQRLSSLRVKIFTGTETWQQADGVPTRAKSMWLEATGMGIGIG